MFEPRRIDGYSTTDFDWPVVPEAFGDILRTLQSRYADRLPPLYITENGCAINDGPDSSRRVADQRRIDYLDGHLYQQLIRP